MRSCFRGTLSLLLGLILISIIPSGALAAKSKLVSQDETPVLLKVWPSGINWRYYELGWTPNYSSERWVVVGQAGYRQMKNTTYMSITRLEAGWRAGDGIPDDIREAYWFNQKKGYFLKFADAKWQNGQRFECEGDSVCKFRNLKFTVKNETCQWVFDNTDMYDSRRTSEHWSVILIHCGDTKPFTEEHFDRTGETIKITYPGQNVSSTQKQPMQSPQSLPLNRAQKKCAELGFTKGTEKFGNCVMKLLN